ncbi:DUF2513 domain-containing protein [Rahnella sp. ChDrAdgB13]|uniref:DUF2513 domain-containing protein n=1 Tax=Rahnella sp. ChDrAdgB13 TaxID=1850581 RepID=UPI001AD86C05|nr:DUF2513 domain-containing protein [Rahnella sp. ChDrAdgB13]
MQIDFDEIKRICSVFLDSPEPFISLGEIGFDTAEGDEEKRLVFHTLLLIENGLISDSKLRTRDPSYIGLVYTSKGIGWKITSIRLTQEGHDFAKALYQKPVLERIKKELADAPFELVKNVSKQWLTKVIKDKIGLE